MGNLIMRQQTIKMLSHSKLIQRLLKYGLVRRIGFWLLHQPWKLRGVETDDPAMVYRLTEGQIHFLQGEESDEGVDSLPEKLIDGPSFYFFDGKRYDCHVPGLYRFIKPQKRNEQRIVIFSQDGFRTTLLLSQLLIRGNKDDYRTVEGMEKEACTRLLVNTCGPASLFVHRVLEGAGFRSRVVYSHTDQKLNSYNNGHAMVEVFNEEKRRYQLIDVDRKLYFHHERKGVLNLFELCQNLNAGEKVEFRRFNQASLVDWTGFTDPQSGFNYQMVEYGFSYNEDTLLNLYRHIAAIPVLYEKDLIYATTWNPSPEIERPGKDKKWVWISPEEFWQKFYSG
jgi:hypothetical protein